jgi:hypothetical protein
MAAGITSGGLSNYLEHKLLNDTFVTATGLKIKAFSTSIGEEITATDVMISSSDVDSFENEIIFEFDPTNASKIQNKNLINFGVVTNPSGVNMMSFAVHDAEGNYLVRGVLNRAQPVNEGINWVLLPGQFTVTLD